VYSTIVRWSQDSLVRTMSDTRKGNSQATEEEEDDYAIEEAIQKD
jgi:hypothetical protein